MGNANFILITEVKHLLWCMVVSIKSSHFVMQYLYLEGKQHWWWVSSRSSEKKGNNYCTVKDNFLLKGHDQQPDVCMSDLWSSESKYVININIKALGEKKHNVNVKRRLSLWFWRCPLFYYPELKCHHHFGGFSCSPTDITNVWAN